MSLVTLFSQLVSPGSAIEVSREIDWPRAVYLSHHHCLASRLYRKLGEQNALSEVPDAERESLWKGALYSEGQHLVLGEWTKKLSEVFHNEDLPFLVLKGWSLAQRYYSHPTDRYFQDIDLLFPLESRKVVQGVLEKLGFAIIHNNERFFANAHKLEFALKSNPAVMVECHFGLGKNFKLRTVWDFNAQDEFEYLAYHFCVQHRFQKLIWLLDLAQMRTKASASISKSDYEMLEYFLGRYCGLNQSLPSVATYDKWFERIVNASIESSIFLKARIRAMQSGGWLSVLRYGVAQKLARWMKATA